MKTVNPRGESAQSGSSSKAKHPHAPSAIAGRVVQPGSPARAAGKSKSVSKAGAQSRRGNGNGNGHGHAPSPALRGSRRGAKRGVASSQPHYDTNLRFDAPGLRYPGDPVPPPVPGGSKVKLELGNRTDSNLASFGEASKTAMLGNPNFLTPTPTALVFDEALADFEDILTQLENAKVALKNLTEQKDNLRAVFCAIFTQRGQYVEMASNGDADIIATAGLPVRRPPTPVGQLPWPQNLIVEPTQVTGELLVRWASVTKAKGYLLQCAEVVAGQERVWTNVYTGGKFSSSQKSLTPGKTYEFRVAAIGGSTGQSEFSPVVSRMAA